jgi:ankyrin repeat protein
MSAALRVRLQKACAQNQPYLVVALLSLGTIHPDAALGSAIESGSVHILDLLLKAGASADAPVGFHKATALHKTIDERRHDMTALLLARGACPNKADDYGRTLLHTAASNVDTVALQSLIDAGAKGDVVDCSLETPLHKLCRHLNEGGPHVLRALQALLGMPSLNPGRRNGCGQLAEELALAYDCPELVSLIVVERSRRSRWSVLRQMWIAATICPM